MSSHWDGTDFRQRLQVVLDEFLDEMGGRLAPLGPDAARLLAEARASVSGGKRFRAAFCYWGYRALAPAPEDERSLLRACAALELLLTSFHREPHALLPLTPIEPSRFLLFNKNNLLAVCRRGCRLARQCGIAPHIRLMIQAPAQNMVKRTNEAHSRERHSGTP